MEAKLIKVENTFYLKQDGTILGTSSYPNLSASIRYSLSLKNCKAIENGYDLDELADENYQNFWNILDYKERDIHTFGFIEGFQKALEILGDKKFSSGQLLNAMDLVWQWMNGEDYECKTLTEVQDKHIQSLQKTEWDVEIVMEDIIHLKNRRGGLANMGKPKLDADECLILKRK